MLTDAQRFSQTFQSEADLRDQLFTLLTKMGNEGVQITHGTQEYGKDIIFYSYDAMGSRILNACVVKKDRITGNVDDNHGARTVFQQVEQALDTPHINSTGENELVARVYVITPYDCSQSTLRSLQAKLKSRSGQVDFLCGVGLLERFAKFWPEFLAFESSFLGSYVASIQREFEQEDPIRFLGGQHSLFASANKRLSNVYVRQKFKIELSQLQLLVDSPQLGSLQDPISLGELKDINEQLRFASAFVRQAQAWESADATAAVALSDELEALTRRLSDLWEQEWKRHESESLATGVSPIPRKVAKLRVPAEALQDIWVSSARLAEVIAAFDKRLESANEFVRSSPSDAVSVKLLQSRGYSDFSRVGNLLRAHPIAFRRTTKTKILRFGENLLDQIAAPVFIAAPAGHGKTSFCKWNTLNDIRGLQDKTATVSPIYVPLHRLSITELDFEVDIFFRSPEATELLTLAERRGHTVRLYLDGLDEVSTLAQQEKLMVIAAGIPAKYPFVHVVVTGRDYLSGEWLRWLTRVQISELDDQQIRTLVVNWLEGDKQAPTEFYEQLEKTPTLKPLMQVPLLGTLIIAVFMRMKSLPENKLKLYEVFTELMCGGWDLAKNVRRHTRFGSNIKLSVLTRLAGQLQINGRRDAQDAHVRSAVEQTTPALANKWSELLSEILEDGLLVRASSGTFIFSHLSFQEYLAATELTDPQGSRSVQALKDFLRGDDRGREVMSFYLGLIKRPDETEDWIRKTAEQLAQRGVDVKSRYTFLMEHLTAAWPGWSPRKGPLKV